MRDAPAPCPFEKRILSKPHGQQLTADVLGHLNSCTSCHENLRVRDLMHIEATSLMAHANVTTASTILWKASLRRSIRRAERASLPIKLMEAVTILVVALNFLNAGASLIGSGTGGLTLCLFIGSTMALVLFMWIRARLYWRRMVKGSR